MRAESLEVLEQASVPPAQARAFLRAIELELAGAQDSLATKHDIQLLRQAMEIGRGELRVELAQQGADLRREMAEQGADIRQEMAAHGADIRREMAEQGADLRAEMHRGFSSVTRQIYVAVLGQIAVMLGFFYFFMLQLR
jgi:DNA anti-recombination protein RmuC